MDMDESNELKEPAQPAEQPSLERAQAVTSAGELSWGLGLALLSGLVVVVFAVQNTDPVSIRFLGWSWTLPLALVIFVVATLAVVADELFGLVARKRRRRRKAQKAELKTLRAQSKAR
jgi:uncharacterized integral membrane protein